ncbi:MAG: hypothetical protein M1835_007505 [Candelina submexicana]|nr:MAG: hypothetical protein M1835_007505 [Candelina submexicana]
MRTSVAQIVPALSTIAVILFASIFLLPSTVNAFPLSIPDMSGLSARAEHLTNEARDLDFSSLLEKRKSSNKVAKKKKKKISGGAIAGIIIAIIVVIIIVAIVLFLLRKRKASGH